MQGFPHHYSVTAQAGPEGDVAIDADNLPSLATAPPVEFDGPGDRWSPEALLVAAVADCFVLTFRAIARNSKIDWTSLSCSAEGVLDRVERATQFTSFKVNARLEVPDGVAEDKAARILQMAEKNCLITSSLKAETHLEYTIATAAG